MFKLLRTYKKRLGVNKMKIEKIDDNKIKIVLNSTDLKNEQITVDEILNGSARSQEMVVKLVKDLADDESYNINLSPDTLFKMHIAYNSTGDVIITLTLSEKENSSKSYDDLYSDIKKYLGLDDSDEYEKLTWGKNDYKPVNEKALKTIPKTKTSKNQKPILVYSFNNMNNVVLIYNKIENEFKKEILYKYKGKYYLVLHLKNTLGKKKLEIALNDFGNKVEQPNFDWLLQEHGEIIIKENVSNIIKEYY